MIEIENLTKKYGSLTAVDGITLQVEEGEVFGLLGPNGAGKTTIVRLLCGLISTTAGKARIGGLDIGNAADQKKIRGIIGLLPENVGLYEDLSAYKNLDFYGRLYKIPVDKRQERIEALLKRMDLWSKKDIAAGTLSKGMKQKLAIARALIHEPKVLFLDEPTANLDPETSKTVRETILELKNEKHTIFLNTHLLDEAERICGRVGIIKTKLLAVGTPNELRQSLTGRKTEVELDQVTDAIVTAVRELGFANVEVNGNKLAISVGHPEADNPRIIDAIRGRGGKITYVTGAAPSLEDVYLKQVRRE